MHHIMRRKRRALIDDGAYKALDKPGSTTPAIVVGCGVSPSTVFSEFRFSAFRES